MNKNINAVVELTEKELACISGGGIWPKPMNPKDYEAPRERREAWEHPIAARKKKKVY